MVSLDRNASTTRYKGMVFGDVLRFNQGADGWLEKDIVWGVL